MQGITRQADYYALTADIDGVDPSTESLRPTDEDLSDMGINLGGAPSVQAGLLNYRD